MAASDAGGDDLRPVPPERRTMTGWGMAGLWASMVVSIPSFYLAGGLVEAGMSWWQGVATIVAGNTILLLPLLLTSHPGARYGIPFPVLLRASFGVRGAHVPALLMALLFSGWCGIECWIGGQAISLLLPITTAHPSCSWFANPLPYFDTSPVELLSFVLFLAAQLAIFAKGMRVIRAVENYSAPVLAVLAAWLFGWAYINAGGFGEMLSTPSRLTPSLFFSSLTASLSFWASVALNIPNFTRYAKSQRAQIAGQIWLPLFMGAYCFAGLAIASSTEPIFGRVISDPIEILRRAGGGPAVKLVSFLGISLAITSTNIPANLVSSANILAGLSPSTFSIAKGAAVAGVVGVLFQPWKIMGSSSNYVYTWLVGCSVILGPLAGIVLTDYYIVRRTVLEVGALYSESHHGLYYYCGGYNVAAFVALVVAVAPAVPGLLGEVGAVGETAEVFVVIYNNAWFFGIAMAAMLYWVLSLARCGRWRTTGKAAAAAASHPEFLEPLRP